MTIVTPLNARAVADISACPAAHQTPNPATSAQINAPTGLALGANNSLYVADTNNNAVRVLRFTGSGISVGAVVNSASNAIGPISPGQLIVIYGSGLGPSTLAQFQLVNGLVPTSLAGTSVVVNGVAAPIIYTSATQVAAVVPFEVTGAKAQVVVVYNGQPSAAVSVDVAAAAPGIFTANVSGSGPAAALNVSKGVTTINDSAHPANANDVVTLYITGSGQTNPAGVNGKPNGDGTSGNPLSLSVLPVTASVNGKAATVQFAGGAPGVVAGVLQVNITVPTGLTAGAVPVTITVGSAAAQSGVTFYASGN